MLQLTSLAILASVFAVSARPTVVSRGDAAAVEYVGLSRDGIEFFVGIPYAQDTSGANRFKPPRPFVPAPGSRIDATKPGPACPQVLGQGLPPLALGNITETSEDCLSLNIARPQLHGNGSVPVMVWIHGGSFWLGSNTEPTTAPAGLIHQSIENGLPIMHVAVNYRLGLFGFAQSETLINEGSGNAGLRDQRLAIEWVRDNIAFFGGDPEKITIVGQSSGGLAIGMQILAYGGTKPLPFQQGVAESQSLEPGITANFTIDAMRALVNNVTCNSTDLHSPETIACLREKDTDTLLQASIATYASDIAHNIGDIWLPVVDGDFLPAAPSQLIDQGRIGKATLMNGWVEDDMNFYTNISITTAQDTYDFIRAYLPGLTEPDLNTLLNLYPIDEFTPGTNLSLEFYRSSRIFRDVIMVCPSLYLGAAVAKVHSTPVYHYDVNQTVVGPLVDVMDKVTGMRVGHTSEFAYVFDSFEAYSDAGYQVHPIADDVSLMERASRSWSTFVARGHPSWPGHITLADWDPSYGYGSEPSIMVIGGPHEGISVGGPADQRLEERCSFLNQPAIIKALGY
ncbi:Alpha/Beta hydrolase protein [Phaeosphaeria sp. MPI-PUGE-AT-0046c]|nr:Alpha/Beta hydrolase protein [Phaeosphaeria sp. MPI-PUGE-AT-0046c]